jgi:hypothetical protein
MLAISVMGKRGLSGSPNLGRGGLSGSPNLGQGPFYAVS